MDHYIEILNHFKCPKCEKENRKPYFSIADEEIPIGTEITCPKCKHSATTSNIENGRQERITGVKWVLADAESS